ncbi:hypothetical protein ACFPYJ_21390 [Paenibacillus solisilvae]|uniref:Uncharacterized protein n=1 Tax=Paenibacillus solisilvae TaxID=2486751 RepID=A0ABW0W0X2_9BACL
MRLDRLPEHEEFQVLLASLDNQVLLSGAEIAPVDLVELMDDDELLVEIEGAVDPSGITELRHVRSRAEIWAAEEIANFFARKRALREREWHLWRPAHFNIKQNQSTAAAGRRAKAAVLESVRPSRNVQSPRGNSLSVLNRYVWRKAD